MDKQSHWGSRVSFIFATAAAAVGLGNIWRFPYLAGENGGGAFVLTYLVAVLILGLPLMIAEIVAGRLGRKDPASAIAHLASLSGRSKCWSWIGHLGVLASFLVLSYYIVIAGWVLDYFIRACSGQFAHATEVSSQIAFHNLKSSHWQMFISSTLVALGMIGVLILGLKRGLERAVLLLFPLLLLLLVLLVCYAITTGSFMRGVGFLFHPDFSQLTGGVMLQALGQAFFSLNVGLAITVMFSAYLPKGVPIVSSAIYVTIADTGIALLAGLIIFPIAFAHHLHPDAGPSLIFQTLPIAFGHIPLGGLVGAAFFLLLFVAAFTSVIALLEPAIAWLMAHLRWRRVTAVWVSACVCWLLSIGTVLSFHTGHWAPGGYSFFTWVDLLTARVMIPVGGLGLALFVGWRLRPQLLSTELGWPVSNRWRSIWLWLLRILAPLAIITIIIRSLEVL